MKEVPSTHTWRRVPCEEKAYHKLFAALKQFDSFAQLQASAGAIHPAAHGDFWRPSSTEQPMYTTEQPQEAAVRDLENVQRALNFASLTNKNFNILGQRISATTGRSRRPLPWASSSELASRTPDDFTLSTSQHHPADTPAATHTSLPLATPAPCPGSPFAPPQPIFIRPSKLPATSNRLPVLIPGSPCTASLEPILTAFVEPALVDVPVAPPAALQTLTRALVFDIRKSLAAGVRARLPVSPPLTYRVSSPGAFDLTKTTRNKAALTDERRPVPARVTARKKKMRRSVTVNHIAGEEVAAVKALDYHRRQWVFDLLCKNVTSSVAKLYEPLRRAGLIHESCEYSHMCTGAEPTAPDIQHITAYNTAALSLLEHEGLPELPDGIEGTHAGGGGCGAVFDCRDFVVKVVPLNLERLKIGGVLASNVEAGLAFLAQQGWLMGHDESHICDPEGVWWTLCNDVLKVLEAMCKKNSSMLAGLKETFPPSQDFGVLLFIKYPKMDMDLLKHVWKYVHTVTDDEQIFNVAQGISIFYQVFKGMRELHVQRRSLHNDWKLSNLLVKHTSETPACAGVDGVYVCVGDLGGVTTAPPDGPLQADDALICTGGMFGQDRANKQSHKDFSTNEVDDVVSVHRTVIQALLRCDEGRLSQICDKPKDLIHIAVPCPKERAATLDAIPQLKAAVQNAEFGPAFYVMKHALEHAQPDTAAGRLYVQAVRFTAWMCLAEYWAQPDAPAGQLSERSGPMWAQMLHAATQLVPGQYHVDLGDLDTEWRVQLAEQLLAARYAGEAAAAQEAASDAATSDDEGYETQSAASQQVQHEGGQVWSIEEEAAASEHGGHALSIGTSATSSEDDDHLLEHHAGQPSSQQQAEQAASISGELVSSHGRGSTPASTNTGSSNTLPNVLGHNSCTDTSLSTQPKVFGRNNHSSQVKVAGSSGSSSSSVQSNVVGRMHGRKLEPLEPARSLSLPLVRDMPPMVQRFKSQAAPGCGRVLPTLEMLKKEHVAQARSLQGGALSSVTGTTPDYKPAPSSVAANRRALQAASECDTTVSPVTVHGQPPMLDGTVNSATQGSGLGAVFNTCGRAFKSSVAVNTQQLPPQHSASIYVMAGLDLNSSSSSNAPIQPECMAAGLVSESVQAVVLSTTTSVGVRDMVPSTSGVCNTAASGQKAAVGQSQVGNARFVPFNTRRRRVRDSSQQGPLMSPSVQEAEQHRAPPQRKWQRACMWGALGAVAAAAVVVVAGVCRARR